MWLFLGLLFKELANLVVLTHGELVIQQFVDLPGLTKLQVVIKDELVELRGLLLADGPVEAQEAVPAQLLVIDILFLDLAFK